MGKKIGLKEFIERNKEKFERGLEEGVGGAVGNYNKFNQKQFYLFLSERGGYFKYSCGFTLF